MAQTRLHRHPIYIDAVLLISVPFFAAVFTRMNLGPSGVDPWLYLGYGTNFDWLLAKFGWTYYAARLPWNLATRLFFSVFEPRFAIFLLGTAVSSIGSISLYLIMRSSYSRAAALIAAFTLQANAWYLGHSFWLYVDSPAISISLLCIALILYGMRADRHWPIGLSGLLVAVGVNIHPMVLLLVFFALASILLTARPFRVRRILVWTFWLSLSGAVGTLVLCTTAWLMYDNFFYFLTTVQTAQFMIATDYGRNYVVPFRIWSFDATALILPVGFLVGGALVLGRDILARQLRTEHWIFMYGAALGAFWIIADIFFGIHLNQHTYYFIYLWVPTFLIFGTVVDRLCAGLQLALPVAVIGSIAAPLLTLALAGRYWRLYLRHPSAASLVADATLGLLLLTILATVLLLRPGTGAFVRVTGVLSAVAFVSIASAADRRSVAVSTFEIYPAIWFPPDSALDLTATIDAQHFIRNNADPKRSILFWYKKEESKAQEFMAICASFRYWFLNENMPDLPNTALLGEPANVVLLSADPARLEEALGTLRDRGFLEAVTAESVVGSGAKQVTVWIVATRSTAEAERLLRERSNPQ